MGKKIGYGRVSTAGQDFETQIQDLKKAGCQEEDIYCEKFTGFKLERPKFQYVLNILEAGDTLVVSKMDRFARSTIDAITTIKKLFERNVTVQILNMGIVENNPAGRLLFNVMSCFAEFERELIMERTQAGKERSKIEKGDAYAEGRPPVYKKAQKKHAMELLSQGMTYSEISEKLGMSESTIHRIRRNWTAQLTVTKGEIK